MNTASLTYVALLLGLFPSLLLAQDATTEHSSTDTAQRKPNIVLIFTDDQGYGDLSCYDGKHVSTPRIDQMASEGSRLTSFYVAAPVCTPSRAALMTGCYAQRVGMGRGSRHGVLLSGDSKGLNPKEITIAEVLKSAGYKTGMFGKWHLGDQQDFLPTRQGFDEFVGIPFSHDIHPFHPNQKKFGFPPLPLLNGEKVIEMDPNADLLTKRFTEHAVKFIEENKDQPFFVYLPHPIPHAPLHVSPEFMVDVPEATLKALEQEQGSIDYGAREKLFHQAIAEIDWSVGQILDTLKKNDLDENTLVIFTSDNGPGGQRSPNVAHAGPLTGRKGQTLEGGMREPTVIRWPGHVKAGQDNGELMTAMDLLPTFAKLAGAKVPDDRVIDGKDVSAVLLDGQASPHEAFFYHAGNDLQAVRSGKWKLHLKGVKRRGRPRNQAANRGPALFDLEADIAENKNVADAYPEVVERLSKLVKDFQTDLAKNIRPAGHVKKPVALSIENKQ